MTSCEACASESGPAWAARALACSLSASKPARLTARSRSYCAFSAYDSTSRSAASWSARALAIRARLATAAAWGAARLLMYPEASSISWISSASTTMPSFSISPWLPSLTSCATRSRSLMICSTVSPPMMDRRCPAKIRPTSTSIRSCSERNRRAAFAIDTSSSPTLKAATARTFSRMPWLVMHSSSISVSRKARERTRARCFTGSTKQPCPVTMRNCACFPLEPEISRASFGAGTCQKNMTASLATDPYGGVLLQKLGHEYGARRQALNDHDAAMPGNGLVRPGSKRLAAAAHGDQHLARSPRGYGNRYPPHLAEKALVPVRHVNTGFPTIRANTGIHLPGFAGWFLSPTSHPADRRQRRAI